MEDSFVIGIAGGTGAGKTSIAEELAESIDDRVTIIPLDNYYRDRSGTPLEERRKINYDHPDAFEWELLHEQIDRLSSGESIEMPQYDFSIHNRKEETVTVEPAEVVVVEGILALHDPELRELYDLNVYVQTDADVRILRRVVRDVEDRGRELQGVVDQYLSTVKPMHERFVEPSKKHAHVIIPEGVNQDAVQLLAERVRNDING